MKLKDATPPYTSEEIGTPKDYTEDQYKVYFEVVDVEDRVREILGAYSQNPIEALTHGYEAILAIQMIPDIIQEIISHNIAIYQVIRYAKVETQ